MPSARPATRPRPGSFRKRTRRCAGARSWTTTSPAPCRRATCSAPCPRPAGAADRLGRAEQELLGGGDAGAQAQGHAEVAQRHLHTGQSAQYLQLVEAAEMADAEHLALHVTEPDAEREIEPRVGLADERVGVE